MHRKHLMNQLLAFLLSTVMLSGTFQPLPVFASTDSSISTFQEQSESSLDNDNINTNSIQIQDESFLESIESSDEYEQETKDDNSISEKPEDESINVIKESTEEKEKNTNETEKKEEQEEQEEQETIQKEIQEEIQEEPTDTIEERTENDESIIQETEIQDESYPSILEQYDDIAFIPRGTQKENEEEIVGSSTTNCTIKGKIRYDIIWEFYGLMNAYRNSRGLPSIALDQNVMDYATQRAAECFTVYDHIKPDGRNWEIGLRNAGAEIINAAYKGGNENKSMAQYLLEGFQNSAGHNAVLLWNPSDSYNHFQACGIGVVEDEKGAIMIAVNYTYTQNSYVPSRRSDSVSKSWTVPVSNQYLKIGIKQNIFEGTTPCTLVPVGIEYYCSMDFPDFIYYPSIDKNAVHYSSSDSSVAKVVNDVIYPQKTGTCIIYITYNGKTEGESISVEVTSIEDAFVDYIYDKSYTGKAITNFIQDVSLYGKKLKQGTDYTVTYSNNINAGKVIMTLKGKGKYVGSIKREASITPASITKATVSGLEKYYERTGNQIKPAFTLKFNNMTLKEGKDYTCTYQNNVNNGKATITIKGLNNFKGSSKTLNFNIVEHVINPKCVQGIYSNTDYTGKQITMPVIVYYKKNLLTENKDYKVTYKNNINPGKATVTVTGMGDYFGTINNTFNIYGNLSSAKVTTKYGTYEYTGKERKPSPIVTWNGKQLKLNTDFTAKYEHNRFGKATIIITGKGYYKGTAKGYFKITVPDIPVYRVYNPKTGEHLYTKSKTERDTLIKAKWNNEGIAWYSPKVSSEPIYRLYAANQHHYTKSKTERDYLISLGWKNEGTAWYSNTSKKVPVYRHYNKKSGQHHYTTSKGESNAIVKQGWKYEGISFYVSKAG